MLPIVKRKTLEVPHGLAAVAAAICLVLAFATDFSDRDSAATATVETTAPVEFVAKHATSGKEEQAATTEGSRRHGGETAATQAGASALINWFGLRR
jgi:hypothetical protein